MRRNPTDAEERLIKQLRSLGEKPIRSQVPINYMIVDVALPNRNLIIEVDGGIHNAPFQQRRDAWKEKTLREMGFNVIRIKNERTASLMYVRNAISPYQDNKWNTKRFRDQLRAVEVKLPEEEKEKRRVKREEKRLRQEQRRQEKQARKTTCSRYVSALDKERAYLEGIEKRIHDRELFRPREG